MLETIYSVLSLVSTILVIYSCYFTIRYVETTPVENKKLLRKVVNKTINIQIVIGFLFTIIFVLATILGKAIWLIIVNFAFAILWLNSARRYLKISNKIQDNEKK